MRGCPLSFLAGFVIFLWGIWLQSVTVSTQERCRALAFTAEMLEDHAFTKSIIKTVITLDEEFCQFMCYFVDTCKSYNLGPPQPELNGKRVCELSSSHYYSHPKHIEKRDGFIYRPSVSHCGVPCPDKQTCFQVSKEGFSCQCPDPGFKGETCSEDKDECEEGDHVCVSPAVCMNTVGSYTCFGFPFHWILDGKDKHISLRGAARYEEQDGRTVLYLDGSAGTYAETPPTPIHNTNLTIAVWIKLMAYSGEHTLTIYGDWSNPWPFRLYIHTNGRLCGQAKNVNGAPLFGARDCTGSSDVLPINVWSHVAMTWGRTKGTVRLFINGEMKMTGAGQSNRDVLNSGHSVYDIGLKRDSGSTTHAYFSDLMMFSREFQFSPAENINEIKDDLVLNHPLYSYI